MGVVYKAKDITLDRDVALKMMDSALARDEDFLKRFKSEAKALARLQNVNIVSVFALRETEIGFCLVMEFVEGNTLADQMKIVARLIGARTTLGNKRQVFIVSLGGFDLHDNLVATQPVLLRRVSEATSGSAR